MSDQGPVVYGGRYELHRRLARGGMADVYLARDQLLDRPVAVKVLFPEFAADPAFVERFRREAQAAANLNHPNIVGVYDWGEEGGTYFIVMEYVDGRSLADVLRQEGPLLPDPGRRHRHRHRRRPRLRPPQRRRPPRRQAGQRAAVAPTGQVKVTDFGIARASRPASDEDLTQTGPVMGTATYFSPEQAQGRPVDPRSDVYSLGVVLYEMVRGRPPFRGDDPLAVAYKHVQEQPTPPRQLNADLDADARGDHPQVPRQEPARPATRRPRTCAPTCAATARASQIVGRPPPPPVAAAPPPVDVDPGHPRHHGRASRHGGLRRVRGGRLLRRRLRRAAPAQRRVHRRHAAAARRHGRRAVPPGPDPRRVRLGRRRAGGDQLPCPTSSGSSSTRPTRRARGRRASPSATEYEENPEFEDGEVCAPGPGRRRGARARWRGHPHRVERRAAGRGPRGGRVSPRPTPARCSATRASATSAPSRSSIPRSPPARWSRRTPPPARRRPCRPRSPSRSPRAPRSAPCPTWPVAPPPRPRASSPSRASRSPRPSRTPPRSRRARSSARPRAGTVLEVGQTVTLFVSAGPRAGHRAQRGREDRGHGPPGARASPASRSEVNEQALPCRRPRRRTGAGPVAGAAVSGPTSARRSRSRWAGPRSCRTTSSTTTTTTAPGD